MAAAAMTPRSFETLLRPASFPGVSFIGSFLQNECGIGTDTLRRQSCRGRPFIVIRGWAGGIVMCEHYFEPLRACCRAGSCLFEGCPSGRQDYVNGRSGHFGEPPSMFDGRGERVSFEPQTY